MQTDYWHGLYGESWMGVILDDAFKHPAKYSRALIRHIYQHMADEGWVAENDSVVDPFGGVGLGALDAMRLGLHWTGVELESRFVALGGENIELWNKRYSGHFAKWGSARILCGDSRQLLAVVGGGVAACVSSPPFNENKANAKHGETKGVHTYDDNESYSRMKRDYVLADTPGNLGNLPATDAGFAAAVSSPPFLEGRESNRVQSDVVADKRVGGATEHRLDAYGTTPGQLGALKAGDFDAAVSSPGYGGSEITDKRKTINNTIRGGNGRGGSLEKVIGAFSASGNVSSMDGDTFWTAAAVIVAQTYAALRDGGHAAFVVKNFVRNKQVVEFSDQWRQLCEAAGFVTLHEHRALVVEQRGTQLAAFGDDKDMSVSRKSFFRRLYEKKYPGNEINWETVWCMQKPPTPANGHAPGKVTP